MKNKISGTTKLLGLIGSPVGHSGSPAMYNCAFSRLGLDYAYLAFDIGVGEVAEFIRAMITLDMRGCNVTMPCKAEAAKYVDELSPAARMIGAVNTIVNDNGHLTGYITDGEGYVGDLRDHGIDIAGKKLTICGAGGAATAIQVQCALDGAREISIFNRTPEKAQNTAELLQKEKPDCRVCVYDIKDSKALEREIGESDILANATRVGMKPREDESILPDTAVLRPGLVVTDAVYNPKETRLLSQARDAGCTCLDGLGMLLWQGAAAFRLFTGKEMPVEEVRKIL